jgi:hypothetical protein
MSFTTGLIGQPCSATKKAGPFPGPPSSFQPVTERGVFQHLADHDRAFDAGDLSHLQRQDRRQFVARGDGRL